MRTDIPAAFYRGGTSKAVFFRAGDLPVDPKAREAIFLHVLGSPDPYGRQLNGLGGGLSSLSKVCVISLSADPDVDLDYDFYQISVDQPVADRGAMCGNMASSVGPFAVESGLINLPDNGPVSLSVRNTNTMKRFDVSFQLVDGQVVETGHFEIPGVAGSGAKIGLRFLDPAGSRTTGLLPTGRAQDQLKLPNGDSITASLVDATNPVVFVKAADLDLKGTETPEAMENNTELMDKLDDIRRAGSVAMGLSDSAETASLANPKVAIVAPPEPFTASNGVRIEAFDMDIQIRIVSMGRVHRAVTLTGGMCLAAAVKCEGFVLSLDLPDTNEVRIAHPSGVFPVEIDGNFGPKPKITALTCYRTQRCLMRGAVPVPNDLFRSSR